MKPFRALRPKASAAAGVIAPPYDVLNTQEARQRAAGKPNSFLHISKPEIDLPEGTDPFAAEVYSGGANSLNRLVDTGVLRREQHPCYYAYQLEMQGHVQTGVAGVGSVAAYRANRIRKHELTRPVKEDDRVNQIISLGVQTGPVLLAYRSQPDIKSWLAEIVATEAPLYDLPADDGVIHRIWRIDAPERFTAAFEAMPALYIADGHHRSAAASRVSDDLTRAGTAGELSNYFLSVAFPHDEMRILDYNRVVADTNGLSETGVLDALATNFKITLLDSAQKPAEATHFSMYLGGRWYGLALDPQRVPQDPVGRLDVSLLQTQLLTPTLGIDDPRHDPRIDFVGGIRGLQELQRRVDDQRGGAAFALFPTSMEDLMAVADANELMPPKSTWFEPKLADGLLSHVIASLEPAPQPAPSS
jgi:uncharacterized protein (DUF1015 family)